MALRAARTLLQPTDRQDVRTHSGTQHHDGPRTPVRPAHRHAPKSGGGMALWRPALPLQPGAQPNGTPPTPITCQCRPHSRCDTPTHREKGRLFAKPRFLDNIGPNQTDRTAYTNTICSSIDSTTPRQPCCRPFRFTFHRIHKTRHTTLTGKSLFEATGNFDSNKPHSIIARHG